MTCRAMSVLASFCEWVSIGLRGMMVLATLPYTTMSQISTVPIGIDQDNIRLCFVDVHDNSCFKEILLIDMSSCTTCPSVAIATHVALVFLVFSFRLPLTYRSKITRTSMYPITIRSIMALDSAWMMLIGVRDGGQGGGSLSTNIRAASRHYSGKTQYMFE